MLLVSVLEVLKNSIKNSVGGYCVVIIKINVCGCLFVNMESFCCVKMNNFFFWNCIICRILCMFPKECMYSVKCCPYFKA